jgi:hypothetical protein
LETRAIARFFPLIGWSPVQFRPVEPYFFNRLAPASDLRKLKKSAVAQICNNTPDLGTWLRGSQRSQSCWQDFLNEKPGNDDFHNTSL